MANVVNAGHHRDEPGTIIVGIDGSDTSVNALRWAITEARRRGDRVRAIGVFNFVVADVLGATVPVHPIAGDPARAFQQVLDAVDASGARATGVTVEPEVIEGDPATVLCAAGEQADVIVVGTGRRHRLGRMGVTASEVVRGARCPVVIVPACFSSAPSPSSTPSSGA